MPVRILTMRAGPELDRLAAKYVLQYRGALDEATLPPVSTERAVALTLVDAVLPLLDADHADGFFQITHAEWADHNLGVDCKLTNPSEYAETDEGPDPLPWSAHIHLGLIAENPQTPKHWEHGAHYCARGATLAEAIARACTAALIPLGWEDANPGQS